MASVNDYYYDAVPTWTGQIGSGAVSDGTTQTIPIQTASGLTNGEVYVFTIDRVDANGDKTAAQLAKKEVCKGLLSSTNFINTVRGVEGTAQAHAAGAVIEILFTAKQWDDLITGIKVEHNVDGTHAATILKTTGAQTVTGIKTFDAPIMRDALQTQVAKTITNYFQKPSSVSIQVFAGTTDWTTGDGKFYFTIPPELNGMVLNRVHARAITAGTTGTSDIQIANVTDSVDILSTKLTIDSAETGSDTAATPAVINTLNDDMATNDLIRIDIDAVSTTAPKGLILTLTFGF